METILWILGIHWLLGILFSLGLVWYGSYTGNDIIWLIGGEFFRITLITGFLTSILVIFGFFKETLSIRKANKEFMDELLNIPHREEIDKAWLELVDPEYYKSLRYNIKKDGWSSYLTLPMGIDREQLEKSEVFYNNRKNDYFRPKTLSHLNNIN